MVSDLSLPILPPLALDSRQSWISVHTLNGWILPPLALDSRQSEAAELVHLLHEESVPSAVLVILQF